MTTASYYIWKWADNDLPGPPNEVFAELLRGKLHPSLQPFDARPILRDLQAAAEPRQHRGEEWNWQVLPGDRIERAHTLFIECPVIPTLGLYCREFATIAYRWGLSGYDEQRAKLIDCLLAKKNALVLFWDTDEAEERYDISPAELPALLSRLNSKHPDSNANFWNHLNHHVSCITRPDGFEVEWRIYPNPADLTEWDQWRAAAKLPSGKKRRSWTVREERVGPDWNWHSVRVRHFDNEFLSFSDMVEIFSAFARNEPRPAKFQWRSIRRELEPAKRNP